MTDNGAVNYSLPINGTYNVPQGYHNGQGKVTQSIATMNGYTVTPTSSTITIPTSNKYVNSNFYVPGFSMPDASVIKKGTTISIYGRSVTGTFEGWVPVATDWYYNGVYQYGWSVGSTSYWRNENTRIYKYSSDSSTVPILNIVTSNNWFDLRPYTRLTLEGYFRFSDSKYSCIRLSTGDTTLIIQRFTAYTDYSSLTLDITQLTTYNSLIIKEEFLIAGSYITRIRVS